MGSVFGSDLINQKDFQTIEFSMMFKLAASSALLSLFAMADKANIDAQIMAMVSNSPLRAFSGNVANAVALLDEFGCWCYFYDNVGRGKGSPVDEVDGFCKLLGDGYQCAILDTEAQGITCVPWEVTYTPGTGAGKGLKETCEERNADPCAAYSCTVEGQFSDSLFAYLLSGSQIDYESFGHNNGFDPSHDVGCPVKQGTKGASNEKACCGAYPTRFPYKTLDGARACCGSRTYNTELLNCCPNGQVK